VKDIGKIVAPEAWCEGALAVSMFLEACFEEFLCKYPRLGEAIHALLYFDVDKSIGVGFVGEVV
jgi:hypothetical protein